MSMALHRHFPVLIILLACLIINSSDAFEFKVGGKDGWVTTPSENYNNWAERMRFQVDDTLLFKYNKGSNSVLEVSKEDYDKCNGDNPIKKMDDGNSVFKFERSGPFFFISGNKDDCNKGQKLIIVVLAVRNNGSPTPPIAPANAPVAPPPSPGSPLSPAANPPSGTAPTPATSPAAPTPAGLAPTPATSPAAPTPANSPAPAKTSDAPSPSDSSSPPKGSSAPPPPPGTPGAAGNSPPGSTVPPSGDSTPADVLSPPNSNSSVKKTFSPSIMSLILIMALGGFII